MVNKTAFSSTAVGQQRELNVAGVVAGTALVASAVILLIQQVIGPNINIGEGANTVLPAVVANLQSYELDQWLSHAFNILLIPGLIGVAVLAYQHSAWVAFLGVQLTLIGHLFHGATSVFEGVVVKEMALVPNHPPEIVRLLEQINESSALLPFLLLMMLYNVGLLLMAIGLWRKQLVPGWVASVQIVGFVILFALPESFIIELAATLLFLVFFAGITRNLIKDSRQVN